MQARSALFDLYGDHLRSHGGRAPVAALVRLLAPLDIGAPAVRTAVSRMVRQGWLHPLRLASGPGYLITERAAHRLDEAAARIYRTNPPQWDGTFDLIVADGPMSRVERQRLANNLAYLGYGAIGDSTWIATKPSAEADAILTEVGVHYERFGAHHTTRGEDAAALVRRAWDLDRLGREYQDFVARMQPLVEVVEERGDLKTAYTARFALVHAWRTFLFRDPSLPPALLPAGWPGDDAAKFFDMHADRLRPAADRYVADCLELAKGAHA
jgi:phenylacetic acid degradation operon negative regulatory protein